MIQPVLHGGESIETDLSVFLNEEESSFDAYIGVALLERVPISPESLGHKMLVGRLFNAGVKLCKIRQAFGHDNRTIKKWGDALKSGDIDQMVQAFSGRGYRKKATPELIRYARQLYRNRQSMNFGRNYREIIIFMVEEVFCVRISPSLASAIFQGAEDDNSTSSEQSSIPSTCRPLDSGTGMNSNSSVETSPIFPFVNGVTGNGTLLRHAGLVFFGLWLRLFAGLERQIICQILEGAVNVEQSKLLCHDSLGFFSDVVGKGLKTQRDLLEMHATPEALIKVYRRNAELIIDGPNRGDLYYFDPHVKEYTGQLDVLKGWCGSRHGITKAINLDSFHTRSGRACFIGHYDPYYDMRERFFMSLAQFDELFDENNRRGRTFVIDRAIYGKSAFNRFDKDFLITWEKGYDGTGWDDNATTVTFERERTRNHSQDLRTYHFKCQESQWKAGSDFRRMLVKATNPKGREILVSVLCNNPTMSIQDIVWSIFNRWIQENDFKNLDVHYGINHLDSRASSSFEDEADSFIDRDIDCPEYKKLKAQVKNCDDKLAKRVLKLRRETKTMTKILEKHVLTESRFNSVQEEIQAYTDRKVPQKLRSQFNELKKTLRNINKNRHRATEQIATLEQEIDLLEAESEKLELQLSREVKRKSRLSLLIEANYRFLDLRRKAYMDAMRVTASNLFKNLLDRFRPTYGNHRDDHVCLRMLTRCSGLLNRTSNGWKLQLWLPGTPQPYIVRAINSFAVKLSNAMEEDTEESIRIEILTGPVKGMRVG